MRLFLSCLTAMLILGCNNGSDADKQALQAVLSQRQQALRNKDVNLYSSILSREYQDKNQDFAAKKKELVTSFAVYDQIDYRSDGITIEIKGNRATISGTYGLKVVIKGKAIKLEGKEEVRLKKERGGWKIVGGI